MPRTSLFFDSALPIVSSKLSAGRRANKQTNKTGNLQKQISTLYDNGFIHSI